MKHFCGVQKREINTWEVVFPHKRMHRGKKRTGKRKKNRSCKSNRKKERDVTRKTFSNLNGGEMMKEKV